ncbi:SidA/IucD/PvdA family monooxygenase [Gulbenkiania indica]|uniref:SidA/IucD/PvdA family monooxygenase n=1 Tax=Gulbenkiania indica TaxID=375574 RepID=UPI0006E1933A|nr:SidA/IucD/PvdA family monooxygenase [Gulbenkiania indica]
MAITAFPNPMLRAWPGWQPQRGTGTGRVSARRCRTSGWPFANPTSPSSFRAWWVAHQRFYRFINTEAPQVQRREFADCRRWTAAPLPNLAVGRDIREVRHNGRYVVLPMAEGDRAAHNLVVVTGAVLQLPDWATPWLGEGCGHARRY